MPRSLRYADEALADLDAIRRWLSQPGSGSAARRKLAAIRDSIRYLRDHPCLHTFGDHPGVRELPCNGGYRVLYRVHPDTGRNDTAGGVLVLRVFGPGQSRELL
ncbi:MAG: type II toxin-antitoxin system RelE/ParE family toxin [Rhodospirillales bacterium]|nr:type II toxin-antitoxin system RelE/ParE family toxin [Rhodospirillales bacterium]